MKSGLLQVFTDKKIFYINPPVSTQNDRVWSAGRKRDVSSSQIFKTWAANHCWVDFAACASFPSCWNMKCWPRRWWQSSIYFGSNSFTLVIRIKLRLFLNKVQAPLVLQTHTCRDHNSQCKLGALDQQPTWKDITFSASRPHPVILSADRWVDVKDLFVREKDLLACRH